MADALIELCGGPRDGERFRWSNAVPVWHVPEGGGWYVQYDAHAPGLSTRYFWRPDPMPAGLEHMEPHQLYLYGALATA